MFFFASNQGSSQSTVKTRGCRPHLGFLAARPPELELGEVGGVGLEGHELLDQREPLLLEPCSYLEAGVRGSGLGLCRDSGLGFEGRIED